MVPPAPLYNLAYFEEIFGGRNEEFREILAILITMLEKYHDEYPSIVASGDEDALAQFRHRNITLTANLQLDRLKELSVEVASLNDSDERQKNVSECQDLVRRILERLRREDTDPSGS